MARVLVFYAFVFVIVLTVTMWGVKDKTWVRDRAVTHYSVDGATPLGSEARRPCQRLVNRQVGRNIEAPQTRQALFDWLLRGIDLNG